MKLLTTLFLFSEFDSATAWITPLDGNTFSASFESEGDTVMAGMTYHYSRTHLSLSTGDFNTPLNVWATTMEDNMGLVTT